MNTDPIADMLTRIRNAQAVKKTEVLVPYSNLKFEIAKILKHENYIENFKRVEETNFPQIKINLKYDSNGESAIGHIKRISKPGHRVYVGKDKIGNVLNNLGISIISTSAGLLTNKEAKKRGVGGEIICEVW